MAHLGTLHLVQAMYAAALAVGPWVALGRHDHSEGCVMRPLKGAALKLALCRCPSLAPAQPAQGLPSRTDPAACVQMEL